MGLSNTQFIERRVYDDDVDIAPPVETHKVIMFLIIDFEMTVLSGKITKQILFSQLFTQVYNMT